MGIAACRPTGLSTSMRKIAAKINDEQEVHGGTSAQGLYLHVEKFY